MTKYLGGGWFGSEKGLRREVLDGAMDSAGLLHRAGLSAALVSRLALKVRSLVRLGDPTAPKSFDDAEREGVLRRLELVLGDSPELHSFVRDCLDHVDSPADMMGFYLHLVHVTRMMQLLQLASSFTLAPPAPAAPRVARARKPADKKTAAKGKAQPHAQTKAKATKTKATKIKSAKRKSR